MRKFLSAVISVITLTVMLAALVMPISSSAAENFAKGWDGKWQNSHFMDSTGIFTQEELDEIDDMVQQAAKSLELNIIVFAAGPSSKMSDEETRRFADEAYDNTFGEDTDGLFYFMDFTGKQPAYDYISTSGRAVPVYQNNVQKIMDSLLSKLPPSTVSDYSLYKDDIRDTIEYFLQQLNVYADKGDSVYHDRKNGVYYYYKNGKMIINETAPLSARLGVLIWAVPLGIAAALIFFFVNKFRYRFKSSANPSVYVSKEETDFRVRNDIFLRTHTTKTRIESSSGSRGGGHSSGGHHGGGGGHR